MDNINVKRNNNNKEIQYEIIRTTIKYNIYIKSINIYNLLNVCSNNTHNVITIAIG